MPLHRISLTIPESLVKQADTRASELGRSRSWLITEAVRAYLARPAQVREPAVEFAPGLGTWRLQQLEADLALSPEERVRAAEETARIGAPRVPLRRRVIQFDSYEDYLAWDRREAIGR